MVSEQDPPFQAVFDNAPFILLLLDEKGRLLQINRYGQERFECPQEVALGLLGGEVLRCVETLDGEGCGAHSNCALCAVRTAVEETLTTGRPVIKKDGHLQLHDGECLRSFHFLVTTTPLSWQERQLVLVTLDDQTDRWHIEQALRTSEKRYRDLFEQMPAGFALHEILFDEKGVPCDYRFLEVNPRFEELIGLRQEQLVGRRVLEVLPKTEPEWIQRYGQVALTGKPTQFELYSQELDRYFEVRAYAPEPGCFAVLLSDISARKAMEKELRKLSGRDPLTGLGNRRSLHRALVREWARAMRERQPLTMIMADIDFFKAYNDHFGHVQGDDCLRQVGKVLGQVPRRETDLAARYGGEEFAILLTNTREPGGLKVAQKLEAAVRALQIRHPQGVVEQRLTLSLGVADMIPSAGSDSNELVLRADEALYQAKREGRARVIGYSDRSLE